MAANDRRCVGKLKSVKVRTQPPIFCFYENYYSSSLKVETSVELQDVDEQWWSKHHTKNDYGAPTRFRYLTFMYAKA